MIVDALSWLLLGSGAVIIMLAALLIVRMPTFFTRLHAASVNETLGPALILLGLMLQVGDYKNGIEVALKLLLILVFLLLTSPVASHALAKAAIAANILPGQFNPNPEDGTLDADAGDGDEEERA